MAESLSAMREPKRGYANNHGRNKHWECGIGRNLGIEAKGVEQEKGDAVGIVGKDINRCEFRDENNTHERKAANDHQHGHKHMEQSRHP